jgi:oligogalacturonide lyase
MIRKLLFLSILTGITACNNSPIPVLETGGTKPMPEKWTDSETGRTITRLTPLEGDHRSFYFHNNPFLPAKGSEGSLMVFYGSPQERASDRVYKGNDSKQLFSLNLKTGQIEQLTFHPHSIKGEMVGIKRREVFYQSNDTVLATHVDSKQSRVVFVFPDSMERAGISALNADETLLAGTFSAAEKDSILKNNPAKSNFFQLIYKAKLPHTLFTLNIENGDVQYVHTDTAWINHVQFSPTDPHVISFCHEGPWHLVDRIWSINLQDKTPQLMHKRTVYREIAGHEFFSRDGEKIWFDLQIPRGETFYLACADLETGDEKKYALARDEWSIHFNISPDQTLFAGDGGDEKQVAKAQNGKWIYLFGPKGDSLHSTKLVNMKHHNYDLEPNVHFTPDGQQIIFRANFEGSAQIYAVDISH